MKKRALVSVSDKAGVIDFCRQLTELDFEIISTGGTRSALEKEGIATISISDITNFPECLDGRVKTLHPAVHAGVLAIRDNVHHMEQLSKLNINTIDIVAVNLYPFKETISKHNVLFEEAIENIDIGGPTMIRAAAKNYQDVVVVVDPSDYATVVEQLKKNDCVSIETKRKLAYKVFEHTSVYDSLIANYLAKELEMVFPEKMTMAFEKVQDLRYGENPHQSAAFYKEILPQSASMANAIFLQGKELSFNNINDTNAAIELLREFDSPTAVAVKHTNPCGVASGKTLLDAYAKAYASDPISIFGGIVALNGDVDEDLAVELTKTFLEVVIAKNFSKKALEILSAKKNLRVLMLNDLTEKRKETFDVKKVAGGVIVQSSDNSLTTQTNVVTKNCPTQKQMDDLNFAFKVVKHCKSNAIVLAKDNATVGIGLGQTNRIWAMQQAIEHGGKKVEGAVVASDAFFPFRDCVDCLAEAGLVAVIQPGGSLRDEESISACNEKGVSMVFCGQRHFKH